jgi:hypothetical protein
MSRLVVFITPGGDRRVISKEFNNQKHLDNFIDYMYRKYNYMLDEVFENN